MLHPSSITVSTYRVKQWNEACIVNIVDIECADILERVDIVHKAGIGDRLKEI